MKWSAMLAVSLAVLVGAFGGSAAQASDWVPASSYTDAEDKWTGETAAYDSSTSSYASDGSNRAGWGAVLKLNYATPVNSDRVRVSTDFGYGIVDKVKLTVTYNDNSTVSAEYAAPVVQDVSFSTLTFTKGLVKSVEFSYHYTVAGWVFWLYDCQLYQCPDAPAALSGATLDPSSVNATSAVMHGKVVSNGGSPCYGRFVFWISPDAAYYTPWRSNLSNNQEFTVALSGLQQNTGYFYQAQLAPSATPTADQIVTCAPVKTFTTVKVDETSADEWVSPSSAWADDGTWQNTDQAMDDDTGTGATFYHQINADCWSPYIHFGTDLQSNGIRLWAQGANTDQVSIDIYEDGAWVNLYQGVFTGDTWQQFPFAKGHVTEARIRLHASIGYAGFYWNLMEVDFHQKSELRTTRYFVGPGADWNSAANWSASSGGAGGASVPGTGCVAIFDANSPSCTLSGNVSVEVLRLNADFTGVVDAGVNAVTIERDRGFGELRVAGGELKLGSATHVIKDNFRFTGGTITPGTSTVGFLAPNDGSFEVAGSLVLNNVRFYHSNNGSNHKVLSINGVVTANGSLSLEGYDCGGWDLYLNGGEIVAKGAITGNGKVIRGTSNLTISGDAGDQTQTGLFWGTSGIYAVNKPAGKLIFGANEKFGDPTTSANAQTSLVLTTEVDASSAQQTVWLCGYGYGAVKITGNLTAYNVNFYRMGGTGTSVYDLSGYTLTVLNNLDLNIPGGGGWHVNLASGGTIACKGNVTATDVTAADWTGATFVINGSANQSIALGGLPVSTVSVQKTGGTVSFPDGITSTAINFSSGSSVIFGAGKTVQASAIWWRGAEGHPIVLRSSVAGQRWLLGLPSRYEMGDSYVEWVDVQDSDASLGEPVVVDVAGTDSGNNINWDFLLPVDVQITTPATSATSPAWVEGTVGPNVTQLDVSVNGGTTFAATREAKIEWFANSSTTAAMGVPLSQTQPTTVLVTGQTCSGRQGTATKSIVWTPTDLRGKIAATDSVAIRQGDSLLLTAAASAGELAMAIDADGDGVYEFAGVPGDKVVAAFDTAGVVTVSARIDGNPVGSLKVVVMSVDLHGPIACQVGYQRTKNVVVSPAAEVGRLSFVPADPFYLQVSVNQNLADGVRLNLKSLGRGYQELQARLGGESGPILAAQKVDEFTVELPSQAHVVTFDLGDGSGASSGSSALVLRPYIPNLRCAFDMFAHSSTFAGGAKSFFVNTSGDASTLDEPGFRREFDAATGETIGVFDFRIECPANESSYCLGFGVYQASSAEMRVSQYHGVNGSRCTLKVDEIVIPVKGSGPMTITVAAKGTPGCIHTIKVDDGLSLEPSAPTIDCGKDGKDGGKPNYTTFTVKANTVAPGQYNISVDGSQPPKRVITVIAIEIVTPGRDATGNLTETDVPTDVISASYPRPVVYLTSPQKPADVSIDNGQATLNLTGYVSDAFADIVSNGSADITAITAKVSSSASSAKTLVVTRKEGEATSPHRPYAFKGEFSGQFAFPAVEGTHVVTLESSGNIIGRTGCIVFTIRLATVVDAEGKESLTVAEASCGRSNLQDFFQPYLVRVRGAKAPLEGKKCYLYDNEFTLKEGPESTIYFCDVQDKPVVAAYLPKPVAIAAPNLSADKLIEARLDSALGGVRKIAVPISPARFIVPGSICNAILIHKPEVFDALGLKIMSGGKVVREFANIVPGMLFLWNGQDRETGGEALTEDQSPFTFEFSPRYKENSGCSGGPFIIPDIRLEANHWAIRVPGQASQPARYASGVDADSISLNSMEITVGPVGGADVKVTKISVRGSTGVGQLDADVYLDEANGKPLMVYTTPFYPMNLHYMIRLNQKGKRVMDVTKNKWDMDPSTPDLDSIGIQLFGVQPRGDAFDVRELESAFCPGTEPIEYSE